MERKELGYLGEQKIADFLEKDGFKILARNYKVKKGEVDIIATKDNLISFIEVKTRANPKLSMHELVNYTKQKKIVLATMTFLRHNTCYLEYICRFDVALYDITSDEITYIPNAFYGQI